MPVTKSVTNYLRWMGWLCSRYTHHCWAGHWCCQACYQYTDL